ncbi:hypothetical protein J4H86_23705 [Spiractinospora alimapuensis]|uniref:hypothetical protein n=1 Tax=Spiractinospora alimapuensis TaxID=2820884 RepID=UPI001F334E80|nr:hypothetical protein [Spiractinospora alimapuensis]QVQ51739.1 hypothetical protein J4H86_23705 [Spiractinospora alimapuensis]
MSYISPPWHCGARRHRPCVLSAGHTGPHQDVEGERWAPFRHDDSGLHYGIVNTGQAAWIGRVPGVYMVPRSALLIVTGEGLNELQQTLGGTVEHHGHRIELCVDNDALILWPMIQ